MDGAMAYGAWPLDDRKASAPAADAAISAIWGIAPRRDESTTLSRIERISPLTGPDRGAGG